MSERISVAAKAHSYRVPVRRFNFFSSRSVRHMDQGKTDDVSVASQNKIGANSLVTVPSPDGASMSRSRTSFWLGVTLVTGISLGALWWGFGGGGGAPRVAVETLAAGPVDRVLAVSGRTETDVQSDIRSSIAARVDKVMVDENDTVVAGDELLTLDAAQQNSRIRQALAALDAAILKEQSAQAAMERAKRLGNTVSAVALDEAERDLALAHAEVDRLEAALEQAQLALPDYRITAPITGRVLERSVEPGDSVSITDTLIRLANIEDLYVAVQIDEIYADKVRVGQQAWLQLAGRSEVLQGTVSFVASEVDEQTGSLRAKLTFETVPDAQIGLTTVANILIDRLDDALTVPRSALAGDGSEAAVFVLRNGEAVFVPIQFVDWPADRVEVTSGLREGDKIILSPEGVQEGQPLAEQDASVASE